MMTFKEWLINFKDVEKPIGDLACDILEDPEFPDTNDYDKLFTYLAFQAGSHEVVVETFKKAWQQYLKAST